MSHSRHLNEDGILITSFSGVIPLQELIDLQNELIKYACDKEIYELVIHPDDVKISQDSNESLQSAENIARVMKKFKKGAIAFVAKGDFIFGILRQLQIRVENEFIQMSVFRTEETAMEWIKEIKLINNKNTGKN